MKVALLSYEYPPDTGFGGIGTHTWYQARALVRLGHDVHVVAGSIEPGTRRHDHDGVRVTRVAGRAFLPGAADGLRDRGLPWAANRLETAQAAYLVLRDLLEEEAFDVVEFPECGADGLFVSTLLPVRTSVRLHSPARLIMGTYGAGDADLEATSLLEQVALEQAHVRISPSAFLAGEAVDRLGVAAPVHVVPNGLDLDLFDRDEGIDVVERFGLPGRDAVTVLSSSRLERRKGVHLLADVCLPLLRDHPQVHVVLAGDDVEGAVATTIRPRAEALGVGDRLHHVGRVGLAEVRALVKHVDIHLQPTLWDNAPYSCIEAMAAGRAVVASDCGGLPELVDDEVEGLLAATGDAEAFRVALRRLVDDAPLRERLGRAARRAVEERYTDVAMARRSVELWRGSPAPS
jgi:glycogen(starch) synthase